MDYLLSTEYKSQSSIDTLTLYSDLLNFFSSHGLLGRKHISSFEGTILLKIVL